MIETDDAQLVAEIGARWLDCIISRLFARGPSITRPEAYHVLSWSAHLTKTESKRLISDLQSLGLVEIRHHPKPVIRRRSAP